ncbi:poly [ADP-ribose] polymerase tankyrase-like isoform X1 [Haliotis rubra]|uniref:poly [ADP-ribose] polymerase tankyrase-like isoform X1 n=1 Tax=Haliotis rubra TaxID=36100 RepID=UPI001EE5ABA9|nr:poly [ADP-ribose] polymerase tankyrase-like isoform X1 [Haliotis rubra]
MEEEINLLKHTTVTETKMIENFEELKSSLKEELTKTFVPPLIKRLVKQAIADIMKEDYIGNIISAHMVNEVQSLKANVENTTTQLNVVTQELRYVQRERDIYRESLERAHGELTKDILALQMQLTGLTEDLMTLNMTCCWTRKEIKEDDVNQSSLTTSSLSQVLFTTSATTYPGTTSASTTDPSQGPSPSKTVPPVPVTTQYTDLQASTTHPSEDPSPSKMVPSVPVETQDSDPIATPSQADSDLYSASMNGDLEAVRRILSAGHVNINTRRGWGWTPVMAAARYGHRDVVEFLVGRGADVSLVNRDGNNILHLACYGGDLETVKLILSLNVVDVNSRGGRYSRTPVMEAAVYGYRDMVELLVGKGADVSLVDNRGYNIIHYASLYGHLETVKLILSLNVVDINARTNYGDTAADMAKRWRHQKMVDFLVSRGAH